MVEVMHTTFRRDIEKLLQFLPILAKIVASPHNLVHNDVDRFKLCLFR